MGLMHGDWGTVIGEVSWGSSISDARRLGLPRLIVSSQVTSLRQSEEGGLRVRGRGDAETGSRLNCVSMLSRDLILFELRSLRRAAVSGSGQSALLTNSYLASSTPSFGCEVVKRRLASAVSDLEGRSSDSLKSWRDSATLRPMPTV